MPQPILAFLGGADIVLILVVCLLIFGPKKLPELARGLGQGLREFKKASNDVMEQVMVEAEPATTTAAATRPWRATPAQLTVDTSVTSENPLPTVSTPTAPALAAEIHTGSPAVTPSAASHPLATPEVAPTTTTRATSSTTT